MIFQFPSVAFWVPSIEVFFEVEVDVRPFKVDVPRAHFAAHDHYPAHGVAKLVANDPTLQLVPIIPFVKLRLVEKGLTGDSVNVSGAAFVNRLQSEDAEPVNTSLVAMRHIISFIMWWCASIQQHFTWFSALCSGVTALKNRRLKEVL